MRWNPVIVESGSTLNVSARMSSENRFPSLLRTHAPAQSAPNTAAKLQHKVQGISPWISAALTESQAKSMSGVVAQMPRPAPQASEHAMADKDLPPRGGDEGLYLFPVRDGLGRTRL